MTCFAAYDARTLCSRVSVLMLAISIFGQSYGASKPAHPNLKCFFFKNNLKGRDMLSFSVIVPTLNRADLLLGTLESIFAQWFRDFEIIVVDDGSTDGTIECLKALGSAINVLQQSNRGAGAARNLGARQAQGKYLAFLDSDDLWFPSTLSIYEQVIRQYNQPSFLVGKPRVFSDRIDLDKVVLGPTRSRWFADYFASGDEWRWWGASSFIIRRDAFEAVGGFTEEEWVNDEDTDLTLRMGVASGFVQITAPATFAYREHAAMVSKHHDRLLAGTWARIRAERHGLYPGGRARAAERRRILTRHIRPVTIGCLRQGLRWEAWHLYASTFAWNAALGRMKYLAGFPLIAATEEIRRVNGSGRR
jgi:glycosyltransferase involved in cell wall biosynthesis